MGSETQEWREQNIRVGFTAEHGNAWWAAQDLSGHYDGPVPIEEARKLLGFPVEKSPVYVDFDGGIRTATGHEAVVAQDNGQVFYVGSPGYKIHHYEQWMVDDVETMVDGQLPIGSVGLLKNRGQAFIQYEHPETITHEATGERFRPWLGFSTSLDGSMATIVKPGVTRWVCENTVSIGLQETGGYRVKHTSKSVHDLVKARDALGIMLGTEKAYVAELEELTSREVSAKQFGKFVELAVEITPGMTKNALTIAEKKRSEYASLWTSDSRVAPWTGTAWGVLQVGNTWDSHYRTVRSATRDERNLANAYSGSTAESDRKTLELLERAMA